jgi:hypothetical protein
MLKKVAVSSWKSANENAYKKTKKSVSVAHTDNRTFYAINCLHWQHHHSFSHSQLTKLAEVSTHQRYQQTGEAIAAELNSVTGTMASSVNILAKMPIAEAMTEPQRLAQLSNFIMVLQQNDYASSVYTAWDSGDFLFSAD